MPDEDRPSGSFVMTWMMAANRKTACACHGGAGREIWQPARRLAVIPVYGSSAAFTFFATKTNNGKAGKRENPMMTPIVDVVILTDILGERGNLYRRVFEYRIKNICCGRTLLSRVINHRFSCLFVVRRGGR